MTRVGAVSETALIAATDTGMHALWNPSRFSDITDYETWEHTLLEDDDIRRRVRAGELVPVSTGGDGAFQFLVRVGTASRPATLTSRETQYLLASSQPYLYLSYGAARLTGLEHVCADPGPATPSLTVPAGPNAVTIHLIDWDAEPGARDDQGKPASAALPDFVVLVSPEQTIGNGYRTTLQTFERA